MTLAERRRRVLAQRLQRAGLAREDGPVGPRVDRRRAPLSFAQLHAWRHQQRVADSVANNLGVRFDIRGALDEAALVAAFETVAARHEVLRTTFHDGPDGPWSRVHDDPEVPVERLDLRREPDAERDRLLAQRTAVPFDLASGPPWRVTLARTEDGAAVLLVVQHLVWDGPTFGIVCDELGAAYTDLVAGREPDRAGPGRQVADVAAAERAGWQDRPTAAEDLAYWRSRLSVPPRPVLASGEDPASVGERGARTDRRLAEATPERWRRAAGVCGVTPFAVAIACWAEVLGRFGCVEDLTVGTLAVRRGPDEARLVGNFANPVTLRLDLAGDPGAGERVRRAHDECVAALAHADLPFLPLAQELAGHDGTGPVPLFDSLVVFVAGDLAGPALPGLVVDWERVDHGGVQFPLTPIGVEFFVRSGGTDIQLTRDRDRVDAATATVLLDDLENTVTGALAALAGEAPLDPS